eukprot:m.26456 g.26456  ORF g.26456 m.26456 type:complete len:751 (+) comp29334_c0_seq6:33-2285(+)
MDALKAHCLRALTPEILRSVASPSSLLTHMLDVIPPSDSQALQLKLSKEGHQAALLHLVALLPTWSEAAGERFLVALRSTGGRRLADRLDRTWTTRASFCADGRLSDEGKAMRSKGHRSLSDITPPPAKMTSALPRSPSLPVFGAASRARLFGPRIGRSNEPKALSDVDQECLLPLIAALNDDEGSNWMDLAVQIGMEEEDIVSLDREGARASHLVQRLVSTGVTVPELIDHLHSIKREDAADLLTKFMGTKQAVSNGSDPTAIAHSFGLLSSMSSSIPEHRSLAFKPRLTKSRTAESLTSLNKVLQLGSQPKWKKSTSLPRLKPSSSPRRGRITSLSEIRKLALVIGNANYDNNGKLLSVMEQALAVQDLLTELNWTVTSHGNLASGQLRVAVEDFAEDKLNWKSVIVVFYCGRLIQIHNELYLVPVDFEALDSVAYASHTCLSVSRLFDTLKNGLLTLLFLTGPVSVLPKGRNMECSLPYMGPRNCVIVSDSDESECCFTNQFVKNLKIESSMPLYKLLKCIKNVPVQFHSHCLSLSNFNFSTVYSPSLSGFRNALLINLSQSEKEHEGVIKKLSDALKNKRAAVEGGDLLTSSSDISGVVCSFLMTKRAPETFILVFLIGSLAVEGENLVILDREEAARKHSFDSASSSVTERTGNFSINAIIEMMAELHQGPKALILVDESDHPYGSRRIDSSLLKPSLDMYATISSTDKDTFVSQLIQRWKDAVSFFDAASSLNSEMTCSCFFTA